MNGDWRMIINNNVPGFQLNALSFQSHELLNLACTYIHLFSFMKWRSLLICWIGPSNIQNWIFNHFISNGNSNVDAYLVRRLSHRASIWHIKTFMKGLISHKAQSTEHLNCKENLTFYRYYTNEISSFLLLTWDTAMSSIPGSAHIAAITSNLRHRNWRQPTAVWNVASQECRPPSEINICILMTGD